MENKLSFLAMNLVYVWGFMTIGWIISLIKKNKSVADVWWGLAFILIVWVTFSRGEGYLWRKVLIAGLVTIWGLRLSAQYWRRSWKEETDWRSVASRNRYGNQMWWQSLIGVFGFLNQGNALWVIALVAQAGMLYIEPARLTIMDLAGIFLWSIGFTIQTVADQQMTRFKKKTENEGKLMMGGIWSYSRHPNYFGEVTMWWGIFLIGLSNPRAVWGVIGPIVITLLMLFCTGVPYMEKYTRIKYSEYEKYIESTSAFFPWFKKEVKEKKVFMKHNGEVT